MKILFIAGQNPEEWQRYAEFVRNWTNSLLALDSSLDISVYPDSRVQAAEIELALVWKHPYGIFKEFPRLRAIQVMAAGVDHLLGDPDLPDVPVARIIDPDMAKDLAQYAATYVLNIIKRVDHWSEMQKKRQWAKIPPFNFSQKTVGIMGLGVMGYKTAVILRSLELNVVGWSRSPKAISGIQCFSGLPELEQFLCQTDVLICMLPLTRSTCNILDIKLFRLLKFGAYLINLGRGEHLVENDLLLALQEGSLSGATLDVFRIEPLPAEHLFWGHPQIRVTPHIASMSNPVTAVQQVIANIRRITNNQAFENSIDRKQGY